MEVNGVFAALARLEDILRWATGGIGAGEETAPVDFAAALGLAEGVVASSGTPPLPERSAEGDWVSRLPASGRRWAPAIEEAARRNGLDPVLLAALVWAESSFRPDAVSSAGAIGLTQLMPQTAAGLGVDPSDPLENLEGGARYLAAQIRRFGSVELGLAAYQAGPAAVAAAGGIPSEGTRAYVERVLGYAEALGGVSSVRASSAPGVMVARGVAGPSAVLAGASPRSPAGPAGSSPEPSGGAVARADRGAPAPQPADTEDGTAAASPRVAAAPPADAEAPGQRGAARAARQRDPRPAPAVGAGEIPPAAPGGSTTGTRAVLGFAERAPGQVGEAARRVVEVVERVRDAQPPRRVAVELPELGGLRVLLEAHGTTVHVRPLGGDPAWFDALVRDLGPGLAARGFELADGTGRDPRGAPREAPGDGWASPGQPRTSRRRAREGVRI